MKYQVFLGGTCNESTWRDALIPELELCEIPYFNPVVPDWTEEAKKKEDLIKADPSTIHLYVLTSEMTGVFSVAEAVDASHRRPNMAVFSFVADGFTPAQVKSLKAVGELIQKNGAFWVDPEDIIPTLQQIIALQGPQPDVDPWNGELEI